MLLGPGLKCLLEQHSIQVEDCIEIHGKKYQSLFLFDHSSGHDCMASDALKANLI